MIPRWGGSSVRIQSLSGPFSDMPPDLQRHDGRRPPFVHQFVVPCCSRSLDRGALALIGFATTRNNEGVMATYTASKSQTQGRPGWSINFRHPLRRDSRNKLGLKVRRGLSTTSADEAEGLIAQMNELLADDKWWSVGRRAEA